MVLLFRNRLIRVYSLGLALSSCGWGFRRVWGIRFRMAFVSVALSKLMMMFRFSGR